MKKVSLRYLVIALFTFFSLANVEAAKTDPRIERTAMTSPPPPEVQRMINRVYEIKAMDKSNLSVAEKKELKTELKTMKKDLKAIDALYIPIGTAIVIILLLILLL
jgi:hypothetical protein